MNSRKKIALDEAAIQLFRSKERQSIAIPQSIREEYRLSEQEKNPI